MHFPGFDAQWPRAGAIVDRGLDIEHLKNPLSRGETLLQIGVQDGQRLDWLIGEQQRSDE
jgi:hypothetical protein